jgi:hypothetical protein
MLEVPQLFWFEDILVYQMIYAIIYDFPLIEAVRHNLAEVWVANTEYTISEIKTGR